MTDIKITLELDDEVIADYLGGFAEAFEQVEANIQQLNDGGDCQEIYNDMLRHLHSIKGNARMCELRLPEKMAHIIEDVVIAVKDGGIGYFPDMGETIQVSLEKVKESSIQIFNKEEIDDGEYLKLIGILESIVHDMASSVRLTNQFLHITTHAPLHSESTDSTAPRVSDDLKMIRLIGERCKPSNGKFNGRIARLAELAMKLNELSEKRVDPVQLEAAICFLELNPEADGMETILTKFGLQDTNNIAFDLLTSMSGWQPACNILSDNDSETAMMLRLCQYYDDQTYTVNDSDRKRAIINTLTELNSGVVEQFSQEWVSLLNRAVKAILQEKV